MSLYCTIQKTQCILILLLLSCHGPSTPGHMDSIMKDKKLRVHAKPPSSFGDSILIGKACAIFYSPDSMQLEKIRRITNDQVFRGSMHEFIYQTRNAHIYLKNHWPGLAIVDVRNARYLFFDRPSGQITIDLDTVDDPYGMYIYDAKNPPRLLDMMNVETQVPEYFQDHGLPSPSAH